MSGNDPGSGVVLDASAVVALMYGEAGADVVESHLSAGRISAVNYCEVLRKGLRDGVDPTDLNLRLGQLSLDVVPFTVEHAAEAAALQPYVRSHNLSLGDCCCLALAMRLGRPVLTGDSLWATLPLPIEVRLLR